MVLRLEECVKVPERTLDNFAVDLGKAHLQEDLAHLFDEPLVRVGLARVDTPGEFCDIVPAKVCVLPGAGNDLVADQCPDLFAQVKALCYKGGTLGRNCYGVTDGLCFLYYSTSEQLFYPWPAGNGIF